MLIDEEKEDIPDLEYALPGKRIFVALIDVVNCWMLSVALSLLFPRLYEHLVYTISISVMLAYKLYAEKSGLQTFGKMIYKIDALTLTGERLSWSNVIRRNSIWLLMLFLYGLYYYVLIPKYGVLLSDYPSVFAFIHISYIFRLALIIIITDLAFIFITPKKQALHDILADTLVCEKNG